MNIFDELNWRGIINNTTNVEKINKAIALNKTLYVGFDPSFTSLHLGNYAIINMLSLLEKSGIKTLVLIGGATGSIGDPSGKKSERVLLGNDVLKNNISSIKNQLKRFTKSEIIDNYDFYKDMNVLTFIRDIGKLINVNYLLEKELIKNRLETGISYTEFSYSILQGYDFYLLYKNHNVSIQMGGSDQWGNITTGVEMIRKIIGEDNTACGMTINLLTKADGSKFGKSESGAIYLDKQLTSVYEMYQFLINQTDDSVGKLIKFLTSYSVEEIISIMEKHNSNPSKRYAQEMLAKNIIINIHGEAELNKAELSSKMLFNDKLSQLSQAELEDVLKAAPYLKISTEKNIVEVLVESNLAKSNRQARELIDSKSIVFNDVLVNSYDQIVQPLKNKSVAILKKGKKNYLFIKW